jgi:hypothetical protein
MKEELITFETAKLAKEKGFDSEGFHYFYDEKGVPHAVKVERSFLSKSLYFAPTQSLLQKWLREVHDIHVQAHPIPMYGEQDKARWSGAWIIKYNSKEPSLDQWSDITKLSYNTYEEALEEGLKKALKLIE